MIVPFAVDNSYLPFDVFAASFYFVTGMKITCHISKITIRLS